ncbi:MAG: TonB-dependent receptor, partial [Tannerella sp.]|nr:TonB-dependent receptor [Tannerella sp.]
MKNLYLQTGHCLFATIFALLLCLPVGAAAQNQRVRLRQKQASIAKFFDLVETQTDLTVAYNAASLDVNRIVTIDRASLSVSDLMREVLKGTGDQFSFEGKQIIIMNASAPSRRHVVSGTVLDNSGQPVVGANIMEKGTTNGTITDANGKFSLEVSNGAVLTFSYIGFKPQTLTVGNRRTLNVRMADDTEALNEVVVVGYGVQKKRDLTGAISTVKVSDEPVTTVGSVGQMLAGEAAGFQVSTVSAQPGGGQTIRIRGAASPTDGMNNPLIIIDGFPVNAPDNLSDGYYSNVGTQDNILSSINPNDIASIEVLKDASSSAIYGARAGNGVIIITTKRGKNGKATVKYSGTASVQTIAKNYDLLNATEFMQQSNRYNYENYLRTNKLAPYGTASAADAPAYTPLYTDAQIANPPANTDWLGAVTRTGFQQQHNVTVSGGTDATKYFVSGNFFDQKGIVKNNDLDRYSMRLNLDQKLSRFFKMGVNLTLSRQQYDNVPLGSGQAENASTLVAAAQFKPILPIRDANGDYSMNSDAAYLPNPVSLLDITDNTTKDRMLGSVYLQYEPIKDLVLKANFGLDRNYQKLRSYLPITTLYGKKQGGAADLQQSDNNDYLAEYTANYTKKFGQHSLTALLGYSYQQFNYEMMSAGNSQFLTDGFLYNNLGAGAYVKPSVGSSATKDEMASFFGRINYSFKDRYLLTLTMRADGASNFAANHRWGYFPSGSAAWRFSDESFFKPLTSVVSNGKLRVSYGETGRSNIGDRAISYYAVGNDNTFGDTQAQGVYLSQIGNPDLKWETTREWNFGLDLGFINNRISLTAEYFSRVVANLLNQKNLQSYQEVSTIWDNAGETQSRGLELTLNTHNIETKDFSWTSTLTFSFYRDKWKKRDEAWKPAAYSIYDAPIRATYGYLSDGLIKEGEKVPWMPGALPGQVKLKDINGYEYNSDGSVKVDSRGFPILTGKPDGKLNDADKVCYGSNDPGYLAGFNNTIRWKKFDFNIYFYAQFKNYNYGSYKDLWLTGADGMDGGAKNLYRGYNMPTSVYQIWSSDNPNGTRPSFFEADNSYGYGDFFKTDAWFIRCRNITLGYTFEIPAVANVFQ